MRLLYLAHRVPDRPAKGDKIRSFHELRALAARHEVHLFALDDTPATTVARPEWASEVASATVVPLHGLASKWRMARALVAGSPLTAAHFAEPRLVHALRAALAAKRFDAAVVYSGAVDPLLAGFAPRVVDLVDVDSEKFRLYHQRRAVRGPRRVACGIEWPRLRALERRASAEAAATVVCTEAEAATLREFAAPRRLEVVGNGVDLAAFPFTPATSAAGRASDELVFIGALDYEANVDACERLVRWFLPRLRATVPTLRVTLVGSRPAARVQALAAVRGVEVHADVASVAPFLARATLTLLPFAIARGVQNKALEALASGLPIVASAEVAKGLDGREGEHWLSGGADEALVRQTLRLLGDAPLRQRLATAGRALVEEKCDWKRLLARFVAIVESVGAGA